jgi:nucleotide-binding universal stress UspA family protein
MIAMATHGRSGIQRWLLGSVAEKVLRGASNHLLLVRASEGGSVDGEAVLKTVVIPLDGSELAEGVLSHVLDLTKKINLDVILMRAYGLPPSVAAEDYGTYQQDLMGLLEAEAKNYLEEQVKLLKAQGVEHISSVVDFGYGAEKSSLLSRPQIISLPCTMDGRESKRWALGSVTERVVQYSGARSWLSSRS